MKDTLLLNAITMLCGRTELKAPLVCDSEPWGAWLASPFLVGIIEAGAASANVHYTC